MIGQNLIKSVGRFFNNAKAPRPILGIVPGESPAILKSEFQSQLFREICQSLGSGRTLTLGRGSSCDVKVPAIFDEVSRVHCSITPSSDRQSFSIRDGSPDGTKPSENGILVQSSGKSYSSKLDPKVPHTVFPGDIVYLSRSFSFIVPQLAKPQPEPKPEIAIVSPETFRRGFENTIRTYQRLRRRITRESDGRFVYMTDEGTRIPLITSKSKANYGVYLGQGSSREGIVVNRFDRPLEDFINAWTQESGRQRYNLNTPIEQILRRVSVRVADAFGGFKDMPKKVDALNQEYGLTEDKLVNLGFYLEKGIGVCRHRALTAAILLQTLVDTNVLQAEITVNRNTIPGRGAHAWCRVKDLRSGKVFIVDPMMDFVGSTAQVTPKNWPYLRARDIK